MKQLLCVVIALIIVLSFAACGTDGTGSSTLTTTTTLPYTTTNTQSGSVTTTTAITTQPTQSTTGCTDATTTVAVTTTPVATTTQTVGDSDATVFYSQHPSVPDYGALVGVDYSHYSNNVYYYGIMFLEQVDPDGESGAQYMQLLQDCGYVAYSPYDQNGVQGYLYLNADYGIVVLFGAAREQGVIVVAISQQ